jgi:hypothetical protein
MEPGSLFYGLYPSQNGFCDGLKRFCYGKNFKMRQKKIGRQ